MVICREIYPERMVHSTSTVLTSSKAKINPRFDDFSTRFPSIRVIPWTNSLWKHQKSSSSGSSVSRQQTSWMPGVWE